jgi:hypothetical protein
MSGQSVPCDLWSLSGGERGKNTTNRVSSGHWNGLSPLVTRVPRSINEVAER